MDVHGSADHFAGAGFGGLVVGADGRWPMRTKRTASYDAKFKQDAVSLMAQSKTITGLARELGVRRESLYRWRDRLQAGGKAALERGAGRPRRSESKISSPLTLSAAELRIADLERLLDRKQVELDLLKRAFEQIREATGNRISDGGKGSIAASEPHSHSKAHPQNGVTGSNDTENSLKDSGDLFLRVGRSGRPD